MNAPQDRDDDRVPARVWSGTARLVGLRLVTMLASFAALAWLARTLPGDEFGRLTFYLVALLFLEGLVDAGTSTAALQRAAGDEVELARCVATGRGLRARAALCGWLALGGYALATRESDLAYVLLAAALPMTRALELSAVVFHARIEWSVPTRVRSTVALARLVAVALLLSLGVRTFGPFLAAHAVLGATGNLVLFALARRELPRVEGHAPGFVRASLALALLGIAQQSYYYLDNLVVRAFEGDVALGHYNAAMRVFGLLVMVSGIATNAALPWLATRAGTSAELSRSAARLTLPLALASALLFTPLFPFADELLVLLFGAPFEVAVGSLRFLVAAAIVVAFGAGFFTAIVAAGRTRSALVIALAGLVLNLVGNLWLVPEFGIEGAAIATFATELFVTICAICLVLTGATRDRSLSSAAPCASASTIDPRS